MGLLNFFIFLIFIIVIALGFLLLKIATYIKNGDYVNAYKYIKFMPVDSSGIVRPIDVAFVSIKAGDFQKANKIISEDSRYGLQPLHLSLLCLLSAQAGNWTSAESALTIIKESMHLESIDDTTSNSEVTELERLILNKDADAVRGLPVYTQFEKGLVRAFSSFAYFTLAIIAIVVIVVTIQVIG
jgi:hypothetical protein